MRCLFGLLVILALISGTPEIGQAQASERAGVTITLEPFEEMEFTLEDFTALFPPDWLATGDARYEINIAPSAFRIEACVFESGGTAIAKRLDITVTVIDLETGEVLGTGEFPGEPAFCAGASAPAEGTTVSIFAGNLTFHDSSGVDFMASLVEMLAGSGLSGTPSVLMEAPSAGSGYGEYISYSPDGQTILIGMTNSIDILDAETYATLLQIPIQPPLGGGGFKFFDYSPEGHSILVSNVGTNLVTVFDLETGESHLELDSYIGAFSPDGTAIATVTNDKIVHVWNAATGTELFQIPAQEQYVNGITYSPDGKYLVTENADDMLHIWDAATGDRISEFPNEGRYARYSPDGSLILTYDFYVYVQDAATGDNVTQLGEGYSLWDAGYSPDGRLIVTLDSPGNQPTIHLWDAATAEELRTMVHTWNGASAAFSPDGHTLIVLDFVGKILVWNVSDLMAAP